VQEKTFKNLNDILENYIKTNKNNQISKNFLIINNAGNKVFFDKSKYKYTKQILEKANNFVTEIDTIRQDKKNLWKFLAYFNKYNILNKYCPLYWSTNYDKKNSKINCCYMSECIFLVKDLDIYNNNGSEIEYKEIYKKKYLGFLKSMFDFFFGENNKINVENIFKVEEKIINARKCKTLKEDEYNYNKITRKDALETYNFNWDEFCKELGFKKTPDFFIISSKNYLKCCTDLLIKEWDSEEWRPYWIYIKILLLFRYSGVKNFATYYKFNGVFQQGMKKIPNVSIPLSRINTKTFFFYNTLSKFYVQHFYNEKNYQYLKILSEELRLVFIRILKRNSWLSKKTKEYAIQKIQMLKFDFIENLNIMQETKITYTDIYYNDIENLSLNKLQYFIGSVGKKYVSDAGMNVFKQPSIIYGDLSYVVNAYYKPNTNSIFIPLAIMQKPFIDLNERGIEYNLANIGFIIAHEFSHALDNVGHLFDIDGNLNNWFTESDTEKYNKIQENIMEQYDEFAKRDGIVYDSSYSIGENIADISGLAICEEYLRDYQKHNEMLTPNRSYSFRQFYTYFCISMRQKIPKGGYRNQLNTNPHPPDIYRTNVPLSRSEVFRATYNIQKDDGMWWYNTNTIW
jgi:putative endopeptidase